MNLTGSYVQSVTPSGESKAFAWTSTNPIDIINPATDTRADGCWYVPGSSYYNVDITLVNPNDGITHRMCVYCEDNTGGRTQTLNILNPSTGLSILSGGAINVTNFTNGIWYDFSFQGNIELQVTNTCALNAVIQALCFDNGSSQSACATPTFSPAAGSYGSAQNVTIGTTTGGATIRYTTNGTTPTETVGTVYSNAVNIAASCTLEAIAYESGYTDSSVASGVYTISAGQCATPTFDPAAGSSAARRM